MTKKQITNQYLAHMKGHDGFREAGMAPVNVGFILFGCISAGIGITLGTGFSALLAGTNHLAKLRPVVRIRNNLLELIIKNGNTDLGDPVEILQKIFQFFQVKYGNHAAPPHSAQKITSILYHKRGRFQSLSYGILYFFFLTFSTIKMEIP